MQGKMKKEHKSCASLPKYESSSQLILSLIQMKYCIYLSLFTIGYLSLNGCSDSKTNNSVSTFMHNNSDFTVTFLNKLNEDTIMIPLSSLVEGCELVQLEYTEDALFVPASTTITNNYIGIGQEIGSYKIFSRSGKFLCNVGSVGQGPGEYLSINASIIDEKNELIYLAPLFGDKIFVYNTSGIFLKNLEMTQNFISPIIFISTDTLTVISLSASGDKSKVTQINIHSGQILNEFTTQIQHKNKNGFYSRRNIRDIFDILNASSDSIYHFDVLCNSIRPIFTLFDDSEEKTVRRHSQLNKDLIFTSFIRKGLVATDLKNKSSSWINVKNDYFGNLDIPITSDIYRNGYFVYNIQPEQLMEDIEMRFTESDCSEKDREILLKVLSNIKEETNNVVFIGKLKNEVEKKLF